MDSHLSVDPWTLDTCQDSQVCGKPSGIYGTCKRKTTSTIIVESPVMSLGHMGGIVLCSSAGMLPCVCSSLFKKKKLEPSGWKYLPLQNPAERWQYCNLNDEKTIYLDVKAHSAIITYRYTCSGLIKQTWSSTVAAAVVSRHSYDVISDCPGQILHTALSHSSPFPPTIQSYTQSLLLAVTEHWDPAEQQKQTF